MVGVITRGRMVAFDPPDELGGRHTGVRPGSPGPTTASTRIAGDRLADVADRRAVSPLRRRGAEPGRRPTDAGGHLPRPCRPRRAGGPAMSTPTYVAPAPSRSVGPAIGIELKQLFRDREAAVFTLALPMILMIVFGSVFGNQQLRRLRHHVRAVLRGRHDRLGNRLHELPEPGHRDPPGARRGHPQAARGHPDAQGRRTSSARSARSASSTSSSSSCSWPSASLLFDVELPSSAEKWAALVWLSVLGLTTWTLLGLAFSSVPKSGKGASAIVTPVILVLQFTSGVFFLYNQLPTWMQQFAALFPLKWLTQGMRYVFLPEGAAAIEVAGSFEMARVAMVLLVWTVAERPAGLGLLPLAPPRRRLSQPDSDLRRPSPASAVEQPPRTPCALRRVRRPRTMTVARQGPAAQGWEPAHLPPWRVGPQRAPGRAPDRAPGQAPRSRRSAQRRTRSRLRLRAHRGRARGPIRAGALSVAPPRAGALKGGVAADAVGANVATSSPAAAAARPAGAKCLVRFTVTPPCGWVPHASPDATFGEYEELPIRPPVLPTHNVVFTCEAITPTVET